VRFEELESRELLNVIIEEVKKAAEEECRRILEEAKREAAKIVEEAKQEAERRRRELEERVRREARLKARRRLALKRLEIRRNFLAAREGIVREILEEARRRILEVAEGGGEEYRRALKSLIKEAVSNISSRKVVIRCNVRDYKLITGMLQELEEEVRRELNREVELRVDGSLFLNCAGGVLVSDEEGREYFNNTLEARLERAKEELLPRLLQSLLA